MKAVNLLGFDKVKEELGFSHCKMIVVGGGSMQLEVVEYFRSFNIPLLEWYGMTESTGPHTANIRDKKHTRWAIQSCGMNISGVKTKIDHPDKNGYGEVSDVG